MNKQLFVFLLIFILSGCKIKRGENKLTPPKSNVTISHCIGRHRIDIPASFIESTIATGSFKEVGASPQDPSLDVVVSAPVTPEKFANAIRKHRIEFGKSVSDTVDVLRFEKSFASGETIFRVQQIDDAYVSEVNFLRGSSMVTVRLESYRNQFAAAEDALLKFAAKTKAVDHSLNSNTAQGFCLGSVLITGEFGEEKGNFQFDDGDGKNFQIDVDTYVQDSHTHLIDRMSGPDSLLERFNLSHTVLRRRERHVANMRAQEWLGWARLSDGKNSKVLKFALETIRPLPGKLTPSISVTFDVGDIEKNEKQEEIHMSDDEAMKLWDAVIDSIRATNADRI
jgi:hypothetical protein